MFVLAVDLLEISCVRLLKGGLHTINRVWDIITSSKRLKDKMIKISIVLLDLENKSNAIATFYINNFYLLKSYCAN